jgi:hypothetical protein
MEHVLLAGYFAATWSLFVGLFALGGALVAHGSKTNRPGQLVAGGLLIAAVMGWAAYLARPEFGWPLAAVLPLVMLSGGVIHVWGRRFGSALASALGLATSALPAWWSLRPVLEGSWESASLEVAVKATAIGWVVVGLLLRVLSGERLREGNWSG